MVVIFNMVISKIPPVDNFFKNGIPDGILIDIFGANGTGKSQFVLQAAVHTASDGKPVLFHDTTGAFRPERMLEIIRAHNLDPAILDSITVSRITNVSEQTSSLSKIRPESFSCLIIDNISDLFSFEYSDEGRFIERNKRLLRYMKSLSTFSITRNTTVLFTNVVRNSNDRQVENFERTIDLFTHVKIRLERQGGKHRCTCFSAFEQKIFDFEINASGISVLRQNHSGTD